MTCELREKSTSAAILPANELRAEGGKSLQDWDTSVFRSAVILPAIYSRTAAANCGAKTCSRKRDRPSTTSLWFSTTSDRPSTASLLEERILPANELRADGGKSLQDWDALVYRSAVIPP